MDTHRLKYFLRVAEEGSMTRAAAVLGIAQPALSRQVRLLEEDLGVTLFRRTRRGVQLTEEGERLRASTAGPLRQLELAVQYAGSATARIERGLLLGLPPTVAGILAAPLLSSLSTTFPRVSFRVTVANTDHLVESMLKGAVDIAIVNPVPDDRVFYRELLAEDLVVVGGPASVLSPDKPMKFVDVVGFPLVLPSSPTGIANTIQNTALRLEVTVPSRFATDSLEVSRGLVQAGMAYAVLPLSACGADIEAGRLRYAPVCEPVLVQQLGVAATSQLDLPSEFSAKIGDVIREEVARMTKSGAWPAQCLSPRPWDPRLAN